MTSYIFKKNHQECSAGTSYHAAASSHAEAIKDLK